VNLTVFLQHIFSRSILPISKIFQVLKTSFNPFFSFTVFHFEKKLKILNFVIPFPSFPPIDILKTGSEI